MNTVQTAFQLDPTQAAPIFSLLLALGVNWLLGVIGAAVRGEFSMQQISRILASQFASTEVRVIVGMLATALATAFTSGIALQALAGGNRALLALVLTVTINTFVAASGLYSLQLWHEDYTALVALFKGTPPLPSKQVTGSGVLPGPAAPVG